MLTAALVGFPALFNPASVRADDKEKDEDRLQNAGQVAKEIIDVPDDIPQDLLDSAACVIVLPSVLKVAFIVGASYGRGAMTDRKSTRLNSSHLVISYAVFCLKKKKS